MFELHHVGGHGLAFDLNLECLHRKTRHLSEASIPVIRCVGIGSLNSNVLEVRRQLFEIFSQHARLCFVANRMNLNSTFTTNHDKKQHVPKVHKFGTLLFHGNGKFAKHLCGFFLRPSFFFEIVHRNPNDLIVLLRVYLLLLFCHVSLLSNLCRPSTRAL
jgi:hypothetical protein